MRLHISVAAVAAILLSAAPTALAAPNRSGELGAVGSSYSWSTDAGGGAVYGALTASGAPASVVPHCSPVFNCDYTLVKTGELGDLSIGIAGQGLGGQSTLKDVALHVYYSDATGKQGDLVGDEAGESTGATASEGVLLQSVAPGYYLVLVDWYLGVGSVNGKADLLPPTTPDEGV